MKKGNNIKIFGIGLVVLLILAAFGPIGIVSSKEPEDQPAISDLDISDEPVLYIQPEYSDGTKGKIIKIPFETEDDTEGVNSEETRDYSKDLKDIRKIRKNIIEERIRELDASIASDIMSMGINRLLDREIIGVDSTTEYILPVGDNENKKLKKLVFEELDKNLRNLEEITKKILDHMGNSDFEDNPEVFEELHKELDNIHLDVWLILEQQFENEEFWYVSDCPTCSPSSPFDGDDGGISPGDTGEESPPFESVLGDCYWVCLGPSGSHADIWDDIGGGGSGGGGDVPPQENPYCFLVCPGDQGFDGGDGPGDDGFDGGDGPYGPGDEGSGGGNYPDNDTYEYGGLFGDDGDDEVTVDVGIWPGSGDRDGEDNNKGGDSGDNEDDDVDKEPLFITHLATREEINRLKESCGVCDPNNNYNKIYDGHGTGAAPPTEEEYDRMVGTMHIVDGMKGGSKSDGSRSRGHTIVDHSNSPYFPKVGHQNETGSCSAWSVAYYMNGYLQAQDHDWLGAKFGCPGQLMSPAWAYNKCNHGVDKGSSLWDTARLIASVGNCRESEMPFDDSDNVSWGEEDAWRDAPQYRCHAIINTIIPPFDDENISLIEDVLFSGHLLSITVNATSLNEGLGLGDDTINSTDNLPIIIGDDDDSVNYAHAVTIIGFDNLREDSESGEIGAFKIVNSWGDDWGDEWGGNGFYWMTYEAFKELDNYVFWLEDLYNGPDFGPKLLAVWELDPGDRDALIQLSLDIPDTPTRTPIWDGHTKEMHDFPEFMCLDISEFYPEWGPYPNSIFTLDFGDSPDPSIIDLFWVEYYYSDYIPGDPNDISEISPDTPCPAPCSATVSFPKAELSNSIMCDWVDGYGAHGPPKTDFYLGDKCYSYSVIDGTGEGDTIRWIWKKSHWWYDEKYEVSIIIPEQWVSVSCASSWTPDEEGDEWRVNLYYNDRLLGNGPTFTVTERIGEIDYSIMCDWVDDTGDHGPEKNEFYLNQKCYTYSEVSNFGEGDIITWQWRYNGVPHYTGTWTIPENFDDGYIFSSRRPDETEYNWNVDIYYNDHNILWGPAFDVVEEPAPQPQVEYSFLCDYVTSGDPGPSKTEFIAGNKCYTYSKIIGTTLGDIVIWKWMKDDEEKFTGTHTISSDGSFSYVWSWRRLEDIGADWRVDIYYNVDTNLIWSGSSFSVADPPSEQQLDYSYMCDYVVSQEPGPDETEFVVNTRCYSYSRIIGTAEGDVIKWKWKKGSTVKWTSEVEIDEDMSSVLCWSSYKPEQTGSNWRVYIHYNENYLGKGPYFSVVNVPSQPQLDFSFMCESVTGSPKRPHFIDNRFDLGDKCWSFSRITGLEYGDRIRWKWKIGGSTKKDKEISFEEDWASAYCWMGWEPQDTSTNWRVHIYCNSVKVGTGPRFTIE